MNFFSKERVTDWSILKFFDIPFYAYRRKAKRPLNAFQPEDIKAPLMNPAEIRLLEQYTADGDILEFGCGGSSEFFAKRGVRSLTSIESDVSWLELLAANSNMKAYKSTGTWIPIHADVGVVGSGGKPQSGTPEVSWMNYHTYSWCGTERAKYDFVLVDGRFRVACILQSFLRNTNTDALVFVHDFWTRPNYHVVLKFGTVVDKADTSVVLRRKENTEFLWEDLCVELQKHFFTVE